MKTLICILFALMLGTNANGQTFPVIQNNGSEIYTQSSEYGKIIFLSLSMNDCSIEGSNLNNYRAKYFATMPLFDTDNPGSSDYRLLFEQSQNIGQNCEFTDILTCMYEYSFADISGLEGRVIFFKVSLINANEDIGGTASFMVRIESGL